MLSVVIVDDSPTAIAALRHALELEPDIRVVAEAGSGDEALPSIRRLHPDIVLVDLFLRQESGIELTTRIMREMACPVVVVSGIAPGLPETSFRALEAGALDVFAKLPPASSQRYEPERQRLVRLIRHAARVPVVTRWARDSKTAGASVTDERSAGPPTTSPSSVSPPRDVSPRSSPTPARSPVRLVVVGASTGGPSVLRRVFEGVPAPLPWPVVIAQHLSHGFEAGFAKWLAQATGHAVTAAGREQGLHPGGLYLAPADRGIAITLGTDAVLRMSARRAGGDAAVNPERSIDALFEAAAQGVGAAVLAVLLTGMGEDGRRGMALLHRAGAETVAQQPESCVVDSMPRSVIERGYARRVLDPGGISLLIAMASRRPSGARAPRPR